MEYTMEYRMGYSEEHDNTQQEYIQFLVLQSLTDLAMEYEHGMWIWNMAMEYGHGMWAWQLVSTINSTLNSLWPAAP